MKTEIFIEGDEVEFNDPETGAGVNSSFSPPEILSFGTKYVVEKGNFKGHFLPDDLIVLNGFETTWNAKSFKKLK